ncbi:unnamed protein product [Pylaiella littoralis]
MRKAKTAGGAHVFPVLNSPSTVLIASALLLGAGSAIPPARAAAAAGGGGGGGSPSSSAGALAALRNSGWHRLRRDGQQQQQQRQRLLSSFTTAATLIDSGSNSDCSSSGCRRSRAWLAARNTRGGGLFRRHRRGDGESEGGGYCFSTEKGELKQEGSGSKDAAMTSEGFAVAAGTTRGGSSGGAVDEQQEQGTTSEGGGGGEASESDEQDKANPGVSTAGDGDGDGDDQDFSEEVSEEGGSAEGVREEEEEEEEQEQEQGEDGNAEGGAASAAGAATAQERQGPVAPLFSFPPGPRVHRTEAEESLQEVLPMQQRLVKYLTEDRVFGAQILCSVYFFVSAVAYSMDSVKYRRCYSAALAALTMKQWGTVLGRVRRVLVPHLLYEPQCRYIKYRARVSALALDPAVQGIVYCAIFMLMPLGHALIPLLLKESVYLLWVIKEVLQIAAPGLVETLTSLFEPLMSVFMTAGDREKWRGTPAGEKRLLLGRRLAQLCFKLELVMPFSVAIRVLPGSIQAALEKKSADAGRETGELGGGALAAAGAAFAGTGDLIRVGALMVLYVKLLVVKNAQLEDDVRILKGLKIRGYNCEWVEQAVDSMVFGKLVGCPWWAGLLASCFALLPNNEATKTIMASDDKLKTLGITVLNLAIGRTPGAEEDEDDDEDDEKAKKNAENGDGDGASPPPSRVAKIAKIAAVVTGVSDF